VSLSARGINPVPETRNPVCFLITLLLPLNDNDGAAFGRDMYARVRRELTDRFGGVTAYLQAPAEGVWEDDGRLHRDRVITIEVMTDTLDRDWWRDYRRQLEERFRQEAILIRASQIETL
jgi:hypothetical protein